MTEKEGTLQMQPSGRWAIVRPGETPHEITAGDHAPQSRMVKSQGRLRLLFDIVGQRRHLTGWETSGAFSVRRAFGGGSPAQVTMRTKVRIAPFKSMLQCGRDLPNSGRPNGSDARSLRRIG
jgi:hypothetical protein